MSQHRDTSRLECQDCPRLLRSATSTRINGIHSNQGSGTCQTTRHQQQTEGSVKSMLKPIVAICVGASSGALLRWWLAMKLNSLFPNIPPGTLVSNLIGGYIVGFAIAFFASAPPSLSPEWRLLIITGFCGALTTFSTFSAEVTTLLQQGRIGLACGAIATHVAGSVLMTLLGIASFVLLQNR